MPLSHQLSHSSFLSTFPFPQRSDLQNFTSFEQLSQSSATSTLPFQHEAVHSHTSCEQLKHVSQLSTIPFPHKSPKSQSFTHFPHKSTEHVIQFSQSSIFPFPQFGFDGLYFVHITVHLLSFQLLAQLSHSSFLSSFPFPQRSDLHCFTSFEQLSQSSATCTLPSPHVAVHSHTSCGQFWHVSASWIIPSPHVAVHSPTSCGQLLQFSQSSIFPFPHNSHTHASAGQLLQDSRDSNFPFPQHSPTSCGQFKHVSQASIFPFPQLENTQQFWFAYWGHPLAEFHGTLGHESFVSGIQSWSPSISKVITPFQPSTISIEYFNKSDILDSHISHTQLLFISNWSSFQSNGQLSREQIQNCLFKTSIFILFAVIEQSLFSCVISHIRFFFPSPSISSSHISGILSPSLSHL